ncbi:hypothetical protein KR009_008389 [Drosophila setifemur]|nr:hypothetical protein KR009_008389 [Drosophila setifemur]
MRRNLRLDWRALALLGALLSFIIAWPGLVFAMPTLAGNQTDVSDANNSNLLSNSYLQSDHSRSSLVPSVVSEHSSVYPPANQSINAEFNQSLSTQSTAIAASTSASATAFASTSAPDQLEEPFGFVISSVASAHLAVLSRTERSIRHQHQHQQPKQKHPQQIHHQQQQQLQQQHVAGNNFIGSKSKRLSNPRSNLQINSSSSNSNSNAPISNLDRNERSTVSQSHLAWTSRKIQLYIKNRILQLMRDGTVNGTQDENSEFTILQRSTVDVGRIKLQSVATCLYLCMDACGAAYGSKDFTDDCVFNENMGLQNYNTYSSTYNSNARRVYYLALNRHGEPRRTQIPASRSMGKLSTYTNAITETVPQERVEQLIAKNFGANRVKHGVRQLCDTGKPLIELIDVANFKAPPTCGSSSSNSSSNVPVPAVSASSLISISNSSQSESGHISSSISSSTSTSNSSNSSNSSNPSHKRANKNKKRKCKPHEQEELHNCQKRGGAGLGAGTGPGPGSLRKLGPKAQKCKELREKAALEGGPPPNCGKKNGPKKNQGGDPGGAPAKAIQQQRSKQLGGKRKPAKSGNKRQNNSKKQQQQQQQQPQTGNPAQHQAKGSKKKHRKMELTSTTTTMATSLATPPGSHWESSSPLPALALSETSDRVERNVRMSSSEEQELEQDRDQVEDADHDEEPESLEDASYEDATSEAQGRSGAAGDDSLYYDL